MRFSTFFCGLACAHAVAVAGQASCPTGLKLFVGPPPAQDGTALGKLSTLVGNITTLLPDTDVDIIKYNRFADNKVEAAKNGSQTLLNMIADFSDACPTNKFAIVSYSLGSILMMDTLCGYKDSNKKVPALENKYAKNMLVATAYGDESQVKGESYDLGTCTTSGFVPRPFPKCGAFHDLIMSYCLAMDARCCHGGDSMAAHFFYPAIYDRKLAKLIQTLFINSTMVT